MNLSRLLDPFDEHEIEWRVQSCGQGQKGPWAVVLAYVTNRAIQNRLDEVCTPVGWKNEFVVGPNGGVLCGLSIFHNNEWITKWDGADNTAVESVKGGLSDAMKRAAVQWGIGRYLYRLDAGYARISDGGKHYTHDKKTNLRFRWDPPQLPPWALPGGDKNIGSANELMMSDVLDIINSGELTGDFLRKAELIHENKDMEGAKRLLDWYNKGRTA